MYGRDFAIVGNYFSYGVRVLIRVDEIYLEQVASSNSRTSRIQRAHSDGGGAHLNRFGHSVSLNTEVMSQRIKVDAVQCGNINKIDRDLAFYGRLRDWKYARYFGEIFPLTELASPRLRARGRRIGTSLSHIPSFRGSYGGRDSRPHHRGDLEGRSGKAG